MQPVDVVLNVPYIEYQPLTELDVVAFVNHGRNARSCTKYLCVLPVTTMGPSGSPASGSPTSSELLQPYCGAKDEIQLGVPFVVNGSLNVSPISWLMVTISSKFSFGGPKMFWSEKAPVP